MGKFGRLILNALTVFSLALCVGACVLWVIGYGTWRSRWWAPHEGHWRAGVALGSGYVQVEWGKFWPYDAPDFANYDSPPWDRSGTDCYYDEMYGRRLGWRPFRVEDVRLPFSPVKGVQRFKAVAWFPTTVVQVSLWTIVLVTGVLPAVRVVRWRRRRERVTAGVCAGCGYDLRATPERCPECGRVRAAGEGR